MRRRAVPSVGGLAALMVLGLGCAEYREEIGRTADSAGPDAAAEAAESCDGFSPPTGDCTAGGMSCSFDSQCGAGEDCNVAIGRCFSASADCRGTLCNFDEDCAMGERCNQTANSCFRLDESQACMPCFLSDTDCGTGTCNSDLSRCE